MRHERKAARDQAVLVRLAFETLAKVRMRDADQRLGAFGDGLPLQIDHPVLGDDEHDVRAGCGHDVALSQVQHDPAAALAALVVGRGEADERFAAFRGVGAAHELQLPAGAAEMAVTVGFGGRLSLQVDLRRVVDRDHVVVLHDDVGWIRVVDGAAVHVAIAVQCRVEIARAERERVDDLARVQRFSGARDASGLVQVGHAVGHHLRMHAKIAHPAFEQERTDGIGHAADADLQAVAVVDFSRDQPPHRGVDLAGWRIRQFGRRGVVALDHVVDLADVHARLFTIDIGQPAGRLDDDHPGALDDRAVPEIRRAQIEIAAFIDRACLEDDDVDRVDEAPIVIRDFTKIDRDVIAASVIVLSPVVAGVMQAEPIDMTAFGIGVQHGAGAHRQTMADLDVGDFLDAGAKRFVEDIGLAQCMCRSRATCRI